MIIVHCLWATKGHSKAKRPFPCKIALRLKSLLQSFFCVKNVSEKLVRYLLAELPCKNDWWGRSLSREKNGRYSPTHLQITDFQSVFAQSASAEHLPKSSIKTNRKSTLSFHMSLRWTSYVGSKRVAQKCKVSKIWTISWELWNGTR